MQSGLVILSPTKSLSGKFEIGSIVMKQHSLPEPSSEQAETSSSLTAFKVIGKEGSEG